MSAKHLVIVESPGKIKTLTKFLGRDFIVEASKGHVIDLPDSKLGVEPDRGFVPVFRVVPDRRDVIIRLREAAEKVETIYLAPDPDREGEAISWHLAGALGIDPTSACRVTFNAITRDEVLKSLENPRPIDLNLVNAQQSRRILDRLVGYKLSPLLWKKVCLGLSAGRVQSVAVLLICDREKEILAFQPEEYWTIEAKVRTHDRHAFTVKLAKTDGKKAAIGDGKTAHAVVAEIEKAGLRVASVARRSRKQLPPPPFITSTLQQDAAQKFGFTSRRTMSVAQRLYEGIELGAEGHVGLISYMRTDSVRISPEGLGEAREYISKSFDPRYGLDKPRAFKTRKGAQDAHEAIRPTSVWRTPEKMARNLTPEQLKLYTLIWRRFVASQMAEAEYDVVTIELEAGRHQLQASGTTMTFDGFTSLYSEAKIEDADTPAAEAGAEEDAEREAKQRLPEVHKGDELGLAGIDPTQHFTQPPPRYSESMLIKTLEKEGIGRPSTYAAIIDTIQQRGYVKKVESRFRPSDAAFLATELLVSKFGDIINPKFTATMEGHLDEVEDGRKDWVRVLSEFYGPFLNDLKKAETELQKIQYETDCTCPNCGKVMVVKLGRTGKFLSCSGYPECKSTENIPDELLLFATEQARGRLQLRETLDRLKAEAGPDLVPTDQVCEACGSPMVIRTGRFGRFMACSKYPECKTTRRIQQEIGVACPLEGCNGKVVVKKAKGGRRTFYGCSNYPTCMLTTWQKPTGERCPECSSPLVWHSTKKLGTFVKCSKKGCEYRRMPEKNEGETGGPEE
ncbi:MAG TPA: type I DNA topoisomerase [Candidatus Ozemobacteraceae bacterium]|nr:type I DNA topoisomerase [Candidatus Ozemobacteraceae bacterium]